MKFNHFYRIFYTGYMFNMSSPANQSPAEDQLTPDLIAHLIRVGLYEARLPQGSRDRSRAYKVIQKIYRAGTNDEVKYWFQCSWCSDIWRLVTKRGTTPLLRHLGSCASRPVNYVPDDESVQNDEQDPKEDRNDPVLEGSNGQMNSANNSVEQINEQVLLESTNTDGKLQSNESLGTNGEASLLLGADGEFYVDESMNNGIVKLNETSENNDGSMVMPPNILTPYNLAEALAHATMIGWKFGPLQRDDFLPILPATDAEW